MVERSRENLSLLSAVYCPSSTVEGIASPPEPAASAVWRVARNDIPATEQIALLRPP